MSCAEQQQQQHLETLWQRAFPECKVFSRSVFFFRYDEERYETEWSGIYFYTSIPERGGESLSFGAESMRAQTNETVQKQNKRTTERKAFVASFRLKNSLAGILRRVQSFFLSVFSTTLHFESKHIRMGEAFPGFTLSSATRTSQHALFE